LPYSAFDKLQRVENKRLGEILAWIKEQQDRQPRLNRVPDGTIKPEAGHSKEPRPANR
jgi:hypothetical protein